jgi:hypothetical protein
MVAPGLSADYGGKLGDLDEAINAGRLDFSAGGEMRRGTVTLGTVLERLVGGG